MANTARMHRVSDEIQKTVTKVLSREIRDPRLQWVSITGVDVSKDLSTAKVFFSNLSDNVDITSISQALERSRGLFRKYIAKEIHLRITPDISFHYDDSLIYGNKMDALITKARDEDKDIITDKNENDTEEKPATKRERLR
ncbi:30S ribosome-binding factor RbfA [Francisellaceae bacterium]|nr:30S ribosome-binding factor RbfA [Francisellaceae bacterium]